MSMIAVLKKAAAGAVALGLAGWAAAMVVYPPYEGDVGITHGTAYAPVRGEKVEFDVWYPAHAGGREVTVGGNGVFFGTPAGRRAPHRGGRYPLVVISHGAGGNSGQFGWIASAIAQAGYAVVLPNHPGTSTGNASAEAAVRVWERPADVSAVLDQITANPARYPYIDAGRVAVLGFSAGGYTAMALSGARVDPDRLQRFCDHGDHGMSDCAFLAHFGIDLHAMDLSLAAQDLRDARVKVAVVADPGIISTITDDSLASIGIPVLMLNLGEDGTVPAGVHAQAAAGNMPGAQHAFVPDATHFSFLAECTSRGPAILEREGEPDPLCLDAGGRSRAEIHKDLSKRILAYLSQKV